MLTDQELLKMLWVCPGSPLQHCSDLSIFLWILWKEKQNFHIFPHQIPPKDNKTCQLLTVGCIFYNWHRNEKELENIPKKIIHPDDILLICVLGINSYGGTRLYPNISSILLHPTIVLRHTLALIQHSGEMIKDRVKHLRNHSNIWDLKEIYLAAMNKSHTDFPLLASDVKPIDNIHTTLGILWANKICSPFILPFTPWLPKTE